MFTDRSNYPSLHTPFSAILLLFLFLHLDVMLAAFQPCPLLGPDFPAPTSLSTSPTIQSALQNLTLTLNQIAQTGNSSTGPAALQPPSWSVAIFSINDSSTEPFYQWHYTAPAVANSSAGVHAVDENSIYRVGSISKAFTVYTFLLELGDGYWNDAVSKYVPELAVATGNVVTQVQWDQVTLGDLAGQLAGIDRDYFGDLASETTALNQVGFPLLNSSEIPSCTVTEPCDRAGFFAGILKLNPVFLPSTTPVYSNLAFGILAYALESITNKTFGSMLIDRVFAPLNMTRSSLATPPTTANGVIPVSVSLNESGWDFPTANEAPAGSIYSSLHDLTIWGRSILSSSLLPPAVTRRWLKPHTHTSSLLNSVGRPWEISRTVTQPSDRVVDFYTKSGNIGSYGSEIVLSQDYGVGFVVLGSSVGGVNPSGVSSAVGAIMLPALESTARAQAQTAFQGTYQSENPAVNSSLTIVADDGLPGMAITSWISNGTNFFDTVAILVNSTSSDFAFRVYPTNIAAFTAPGSKRVAFRIVPQDVNTFSSSIANQGIFSSSCETWLGVDAVNYGNVGLDEVIFDVGEGGAVESVEAPSLRITMMKEV